MKNKRGDLKWDVLLALILGLLVLALSLFFIFQEYFTKDDLDWENCRQSIVLRANMPEYQFAGLNLVTFKDSFPLKCKTRVIKVDKGEVSSLDETIARTMAECWALFDSGDSNAFPSELFRGKTSCVPCARIHLTDEAKDELKKRGALNIRNSLDSRMDSNYSYWEYLNNSGKKFPAFNPGSATPFDFEGDSFNIKENPLWGITNSVDAINRLNGVTIVLPLAGEVSLPREFSPEKGDLIINYGVMNVYSGNFGGYVPYLFYFQNDQEPNPFDEMKKNLFGSTNICEYWEGIPA